MAAVKFLRKLTSEIEGLPIIDGQLIYNIENGAQYMDYGSQRLSIGINNLPLATLEKAGILMPDGETLTVNNGILSVIAENIDGKSAYELAVENGYTGTLSDWLISLKGQKGDKGAKGDKGEDGAKGDKGDTGTKGNDGVNGTNGLDGKSAYQMAVEGGYLKTESEFVGQLAELGSPLPVASASAMGIVKPDNDTITVSGGVIKAKQYVLPNATAEQYGAVKIGSYLKLSANNALTTDISRILLELHKGEFLFTSSNSLIISNYGFDKICGERLYLRFKQIVPFVEKEYVINNFNPHKLSEVSYTFAVDDETSRTVTIARNTDGSIKISCINGNMSLADMYIIYNIKFNTAIPSNVLVAD